MDEFTHSHNELIKERNNIINKIMEVKRDLELLQKKEKYIHNSIMDNCVKYNKKHDWETHREDGPYGERFYICKHCDSMNY